MIFVMQMYIFSTRNNLWKFMIIVVMLHLKSKNYLFKKFWLQEYAVMYIVCCLFFFAGVITASSSSKFSNELVIASSWRAQNDWKGIQFNIRWVNLVLLKKKTCCITLLQMKIFIALDT